MVLVQTFEATPCQKEEFSLIPCVLLFPFNVLTNAGVETRAGVKARETVHYICNM